MMKKLWILIVLLSVAMCSIAQSRLIKSNQSGRLFLGINDDHPSNNEGTFRAWVRVSYK